MALRGYIWLHHVARTPFDVAAQPRVHEFMTSIYYPTWTRLDGLLAGVAAAAIQVFRPALWDRLTARPNLLFATGVAGLGAAILAFPDQASGFWPTVFGFPLLAFSVVLIVMAASSPRSLLGRRAIPGAGGLATGAYSLYLSHKAVFHAVQTATPHLPAQLQGLSFVLALLGAFVVGAVLYWLVERPFLKLRDRLEGPSRSSLAFHAGAAAIRSSVAPSP